MSFSFFNLLDVIDFLIQSFNLMLMLRVMSISQYITDEDLCYLYIYKSWPCLAKFIYLRTICIFESLIQSTICFFYNYLLLKFQRLLYGINNFNKYFLIQSIIMSQNYQKQNIPHLQQQPNDSFSLLQEQSDSSVSVRQEQSVHSFSVSQDQLVNNFPSLGMEPEFTYNNFDQLDQRELSNTQFKPPFSDRTQSIYLSSQSPYELTISYEDLIKIGKKKEQIEQYLRKAQTKSFKQKINNGKEIKYKQLQKEFDFYKKKQNPYGDSIPKIQQIFRYLSKEHEVNGYNKDQYDWLLKRICFIKDVVMSKDNLKTARILQINQIYCRKDYDNPDPKNRYYKLRMQIKNIKFDEFKQVQQLQLSQSNFTDSDLQQILNNFLYLKKSSACYCRNICHIELRDLQKLQ